MEAHALMDDPEFNVSPARTLELVKPDAILAPLEDLPSQCTAKSKQTGVQCKNRIKLGFTVCRFHGGASKSSIDGALKRLIHARDAALRKLTFQLEHTDDMDPRVLLDVTTKLGVQIDLLEGRATSRTETTTTVNVNEIRTRVQTMLDDARDRRTLMEGQIG